MYDSGIAEGDLAMPARRQDVPVRLLYRSEWKMAIWRNRRGEWQAAIVGALFLIALGALPARAGNDCETGLNASFENELIVLINAQRGRSGLAPLALQSQLKFLARAHCADMACSGSVSHAGPTGPSTRERVAAQGYRFQAVGENIGAGYDTPQQVLHGWMNSVNHRKAILNPSFKEIGTGYAFHPGSQYRNYWTAIFGNPSKSSSH
jgi:uncharacterized protein YkwD